MKPSNSHDVVVLGGVSIEHSLRCARLPEPGECVDGHALHESLGGKGARQAIGAARLGATVALLAKVGLDRQGDRALELLKTEGVECEAVTRDIRNSTGALVTLTDESLRPASCLVHGANSSLRPSDVHASRSLFEGCKILIAQLEVPLETVEAALELAKAMGARTILDASPPRKIPPSILSKVDILCASARATEELVGLHVTNRALAARAAEQFCAQGVHATVMQVAGDGNMVFTTEQELWLPRFRVTTVDSSGAGDALASALAAMLAEGKDLFHATLVANAAAALASTRPGAMESLPMKDDVMELLNRAADGSGPGSVDTAA